MNILIIGAAGGIGSKLVQDLMGTSNLLLGYYNSSLNVPIESEKVDAADFKSVESFIKKGLEKFILSVSENGYGKRTNISEFSGQKRGGKGVIALNTSQRNGKMIKPSGKKKYGGNKSEVKSPKIK